MKVFLGAGRGPESNQLDFGGDYPDHELHPGFFKPPPPVGAGGGYMFSGRPSVPLSVRAFVRLCVRPSVRDSFTW